MAEIHSKVLLVEGKQDVRVIPELIEANGVPWGKRKSSVGKKKKLSSIYA
jgi:5S rRNA maturation endonuclease (ribonuclease M5)